MLYTCNIVQSTGELPYVQPTTNCNSNLSYIIGKLKMSSITYQKFTKIGIVEQYIIQDGAQDGRHNQ